MKLVRLEREKVRQAITDAKSQEDALAALYAFVFGKEKIKEMEGVPLVSPSTHNEITTLFKKRDSAEHPGHSSGGVLWIQYGFQVGEEVPDWFVDIEGIVLKKETA